MTKPTKSAEAAGWYGTSAIITAYALVSFHVITVDGLAYQLLNLTGALGVIIIAHARQVRQSVTLNIFWAAVAIIALIRMAG